ncbi:hypothetical protein LMG33818_001804 [Halomonadaceae bacterium LMG 33818]|uniref:APC family permease n=1 Tax=Cernens ardua TaxID=3402176 RepID=UPI003EDBB3C7
MSENNKNAHGQLRKGSIGMAHIVFFVVAAAAPMTAVVGATPPAFAFGNGAGVPGAFIIAGILYLLFSRPFTTMSLYIEQAGAFYEYVTRGLGRVMGCASATIAVVAYFAIQLSIYALFGVFMSGVIGHLGIDCPWWLCALVALAAVILLGMRNIEVSGRILGLCMIGELLILLFLDIAIVLKGGHPQGISWAGFRPSEVFTPGLGASMVFVLGAYVGFEATAIFSEEAKNPKKTIPRATYIAVLLITGFYALSTWAIVQYYGVSNVQHIAASSLDNFYFNAARALLGDWSVEVMNILLLTSLFACLLSFHNTLNRYFYSFGQRVNAWRVLGKIHVRHGSPYIAGYVQAGIVLAIIIVFSLLHSDPYAFVFPLMSALAVLAIVTVQILVMVSAVVFFRRIAHPHSLMTTTFLPILALIGLVTAWELLVSNLGLLTGSKGLLVMSLPWLVIGAGLLGGVFASFFGKRSNTPLTELHNH